MKRCSHKPHSKKKSAYGSKRTLVWCDGCDAQLVPPIPNKKRARVKARKEIKDES